MTRGNNYFQPLLIVVVILYNPKIQTIHCPFGTFSCSEHGRHTSENWHIRPWISLNRFYRSEPLRYRRDGSQSGSMIYSNEKYTQH